MFTSLKGKRIYSILNNKCPVCHEGDFFEVNNPYDLKNFSKNYDRCKTCDHKFEMETGFFYGAMFVSYAIAVAFSIAIFLMVLLLFPQSAYYVYIAAILTGIVVLMPLTYRLSRLVWMNLFYGFQSEKAVPK